MHILFIGGTRFAGYFAAQHALARGHRVTLFNRGKSGAPLGVFPGVEQVTGDRETADIERLRGRVFDAVIDMAGYFPRSVRALAGLLSGHVGRYLFVSTISVYAQPIQLPFDESHALEVLADPDVTEIGPHYGGLKALCERAVTETFGAAAIIARPGLIVGPRDPTHRFDYWVERVARGGEVLAPDSPDARVQFIDARDLGEWLVRLVEREPTGAGAADVYNAVCAPLTLGAFLDACAAASGSDATFTWVPESWLLAQGVQPWADLPLWVGSADAAFTRAANQRAIAAGLTFRTLENTVRDTLAWVRANRDVFERRRGALSREREGRLLADYRNI